MRMHVNALPTVFQRADFALLGQDHVFELVYALLLRGACTWGRTVNKGEEKPRKVKKKIEKKWKKNEKKKKAQSRGEYASERADKLS